MTAVRKPKSVRAVEDRWLSLLAASRQLGIPRQTVLVRVIRGELEAAVRGERVVISRESVARETEKLTAA